jgi:hypothetical protein
MWRLALPWHPDFNQKRLLTIKMGENESFKGDISGLDTFIYATKFCTAVRLEIKVYDWNVN